MEHPQPDDKNWTWVLERPCPDCSFDASTIARHAIGATLRTNMGAWHEVLSRGALVRQRPPGGRMGESSGPPSNTGATCAMCSSCLTSAFV